MKGVTPLIAVVILIAVTLSVGVLVANFIMNLSQRVVEHTSSDIETGIRCGNAALDFDASFGSLGVDWDFGGADRLDVKVVNTGTVNLYGFSIEAVINSGGTAVKELGVQAGYDRPRNNPLRPAQSAMLKANITENLAGTLESVKVLNEACPAVFVEREI